MPSGGDGWSEYRRLVTHELERLHGWCESQDQRIGDLRATVAGLRARVAILMAGATVLGGLLGAIGSRLMGG